VPSGVGDQPGQKGLSCSVLSNTATLTPSLLSVYWVPGWGDIGALCLLPSLAV
jgi:hypothetical protein